jgi:hypothetical protein
VALLAAVLWKVGWPQVEANLARVGWWFFPLVLFWALPFLAYIEAWRQVFSPRPPAASLPGLTAAFLAGETANYVGAGVAGEPLRAMLVRERFGSANSFASINLRKQAELGAQVAFLVVGVGFALGRYHLPRPWAIASAGGVLVMTALLVLMTWALGRGSYSPLLVRLGGWKVIAPHLRRIHEGAADVDAAILRFYGENPARFAGSVGWSLAALGGGWIETWLILRLLGVDAGWGVALAIEALTMTLNTMLLFIPGRLGGAEVIRAGIFVALGLPAASGLAYSLVRRGREFFWTLVGAVVLVRRHAASLLSGDAPEGAALASEEKRA